MTKAIAYYRVSTDIQKEEKTIEIQQMKVKEFARKFNYELEAEYFDDGVSGGLKDRPGLRKMFDAISGIEAKCVIIYKLDRLARDLYIQEGLIQEINKAGKQLISTLEPDLDNADPFRKAFRQMLGVFSEFEKAMIALRLEGGRERKAQLGGWHGGHIFGYENVNGSLKVIPEEAEIIKLIFKSRREKVTYSEIASILTSKEVPTKRGNKTWCASSIRKICKNPIYKTGNIIYKGSKYKSKIKPIVA